MILGCDSSEKAKPAAAIDSQEVVQPAPNGTVHELFYYPNSMRRNATETSKKNDTRVQVSVHEMIVVPSKPSIAIQDDKVIFVVTESNGRFHRGDRIILNFDQYMLGPGVFHVGQRRVMGLLDHNDRLELTSLKIK